MNIFDSANIIISEAPAKVNADLFDSRGKTSVVFLHARYSSGLMPITVRSSSDNEQKWNIVGNT